MYLVSVRARSLGACPLAGWSGSFVYSVLLSLIRRSAEPKGRVLAWPLMVRGRPVLSGVDGRGVVLEEGALVEFVAVLGGEDLRLLMEGVSGGDFKAECGSFKPLELEFWRLEPSPGGGHGFALAELEFYPTAFMFHGVDVLRPSAVRMAYSLAKSYREVFGVDVKNLADRAGTALEFVWDSTKRVKVDIGGGRAVPAFMGRATLAIFGDVETWLGLLKLGEAVGVGISRSIGFGRYKVLKVEKKI